MPSLTKRQMDVARFVWAYVRDNGVSPSLREIAEKLDVSTVTVWEHVSHLVEKGVLRPGRGAVTDGRRLGLRVDDAAAKDLGLLERRRSSFKAQAAAVARAKRCRTCPQGSRLVCCARCQVAEEIARALEAHPFAESF